MTQPAQLGHVGWQAQVPRLVDGSGSGDVDCSTVRTADDSGYIEGLTWPELQTQSDLELPFTQSELRSCVQLFRSFLMLRDGAVRIVEALYELFPNDLASRLKAQRAKSLTKWQELEKQEESRQLQEWNAAHPKPTLAEKKSS